jgi:hypothetical protein
VQIAALGPLERGERLNEGGSIRLRDGIVCGRHYEHAWATGSVARVSHQRSRRQRCRNAGEETDESAPPHAITRRTNEWAKTGL